MGVERPDRHMGQHRGQQRCFLTLPLPTFSQGAKLAHGGTRRATGVFPSWPASVAAMERGCRGQRHLPSRRTALSRTLYLPPLGAMGLAIFVWLSAADGAVFGEQLGFKYSELQFFLIYPLRLLQYPPAHHDTPETFVRHFCIGYGIATVMAIKITLIQT